MTPGMLAMAATVRAWSSRPVGRRRKADLDQLAGGGPASGTRTSTRHRGCQPSRRADHPDFVGACARPVDEIDWITPTTSSGTSCAPRVERRGCRRISPGQPSGRSSAVRRRVHFGQREVAACVDVEGCSGSTLGRTRHRASESRQTSRQRAGRWPHQHGLGELDAFFTTAMYQPSWFSFPRGRGPWQSDRRWLA